MLSSRLFTDSELNGLCAGFALDVAAPVELALATLFHSAGGNREKYDYDEHDHDHDYDGEKKISKTTKSRGLTKG